MEHTHDHEHNRKPIINRLSRAQGHLAAVKKMAEEDRDCEELIVQLEAVISALKNTQKLILEDHIKHCIVHAVMDGDLDKIDELNKAIDKML